MTTESIIKALKDADEKENTEGRESLMKWLGYVMNLSREKSAKITEHVYKFMQDKPVERFNMPTDKQIIDIAVLFNDGRLNEKELTNMVSMCAFVLDRLYENNSVLKPSSKE